MSPLLFIVLLCFSAISASSNDNSDNNEAEDFNEHEMEGFNELMAVLNDDALRYYLESDTPIDYDLATSILITQITDIQGAQCKACITGCRMFSGEDGDLVKLFLDKYQPKTYQMISGMKPIIVSLQSLPLQFICDCGSISHLIYLC